MFYAFWSLFLWPTCPVHWSKILETKFCAHQKHEFSEKMESAAQKLWSKSAKIPCFSRFCVSRPECDYFSNSRKMIKISQKFWSNGNWFLAPLDLEKHDFWPLFRVLGSKNRSRPKAKFQNLFKKMTTFWPKFWCGIKPNFAQNRAKKTRFSATTRGPFSKIAIAALITFWPL